MLEIPYKKSAGKVYVVQLVRRIQTIIFNKSIYVTLKTINEINEY